MKKQIIIAVTAIILSGCATITNDAYIPVALSFSDGSAGVCHIRNKRFNKSMKVPGTELVRRSDDDLILDCETSDGRKVISSVESKIASEYAASVLLDFGITDAITDKHRYYASSFIIPVPKKK